jgi:hypothetical protein
MLQPSDIGKNLAPFFTFFEELAKRGVSTANLKYLRSGMNHGAMGEFGYMIRTEMSKEEIEALYIMGICNHIPMRPTAEAFGFTPDEWRIIMNRPRLRFSKATLLQCALENERKEAKWVLVYLPGLPIAQVVDTLSSAKVMEFFGFISIVEKMVQIKSSVLRQDAIRDSGYALINIHPRLEPISNGLIQKRVTGHRMVEALTITTLNHGYLGLPPHSYCVCEEPNIVIRTNPHQIRSHAGKSVPIHVEMDVNRMRAEYEIVSKVQGDAVFAPCWEVVGR